MARQLEEWGGEVRAPGWLRRVLRMPPPAEDTPEARHEARARRPTRTVAQNADRAAVGALSSINRESRGKRP